MLNIRLNSLQHHQYLRKIQAYFSEDINLEHDPQEGFNLE